MNRNVAFTLIELLVVLVIILVLGALVLPFLTAGQEQSRSNETKILLSQLGVAIDRFVAETSAVPLPTGSAADPLSGSWYPVEHDGAWDKQQLVWRLTHEMSLAEKKTMQAEARKADLAIDPYQDQGDFEARYDLKTAAGLSAARTDMNQAISKLPSNSYFDTYYFRLTSNWTKISYMPFTDIDYRIVNQYNQLQKNVIFTGRGFYKRHYMAMKGAIAYDLTRRMYLTHPCLDVDAIDSSFLDDDTILDAWGNPLIYIAHSTPAYGEQRYYNSNGKNYERPIGVPAAGRIEITDRNRDGSINRKDWTLAPPYEDLSDENRDQQLDQYDMIDHNNDGNIDEHDWGSILYNAWPGRGSSYFLCSAGPDMLFDCLLPSFVNDDNIFLNEDYND